MEGNKYLSHTYFFDYNAPEIQNLIEEYEPSEQPLLEIIKSVYLKVRDGWRYDPYTITIDPKRLSASAICKKEKGHCIDKAILLIACLRGLGIPARLCLAKVANHIAVERLTERFGTNVLTPHGIVDIYIHEKWVKATPAFNKELCERCNVAPLEFDGEEDSVFQEFNAKGHQFMEYLEDYGHFDDVPIDFMRKNLMENYPTIFQFEKGIVAYKF